MNNESSRKVAKFDHKPLDPISRIAIIREFWNQILKTAHFT